MLPPQCVLVFPGPKSQPITRQACKHRLFGANYVWILSKDDTFMLPNTTDCDLNQLDQLGHGVIWTSKNYLSEREPSASGLVSNQITMITRGLSKILNRLELEPRIPGV